MSILLFSLLGWPKPEANGDYIPLDTRPRKSRWKVPKLARGNGIPTCASIALAVLAGICICFTVSTFRRRPEYVLQLPLLPETTSDHAYEPPPPLMPITGNDDLNLEDLRNIVSRSKGYWVRDYSLNLGWNNMRYIIETALLHGVLLNRTVVLPSFVYARSCEHNVAVCAKYAHMVNHGDAVGSDEWRKLPMDEQMSWQVPISVMLNMTLLRNTQPVITVAEYLRLHNLSEDMEESNGHWERHKYHQHPYVFDNTSRIPSLHVIENSWYDPWDINRVDVIPEDMKRRGGWQPEGGDSQKGEKGQWADAPTTSVYLALQAALPTRPKVLEWDRAAHILRETGHTWETDEEMERILNENGWEVLFTYRGAIGMEYVKNVVSPVRQVAPRQTLRGLQEDYGHLTADVVLLAGEVHYERKPGSLRFTSVARRDSFSRLVLYHVHATNKVYELAASLAARVKEQTGGRMWLGAHMRRGDFVRTHWAMETTVEAHLSRIQGHLATGRTVLRSLRADELQAYDIPDAAADRTVTQSQPPQDTDKFYLATDERDPGNIAYLTDHGAILASSLLTIEDRRAFGWPLLLTDVLGLVEQAVLAQAYYFYAHALSSYAGGTINMRAVRGLDPRTAVID